MIQPSLEALKELAGQGTVISVSKDILGDLVTPAAAFLRIAHGRRRVFLLESVEGGERLARYSFIGWDPFLVVRGSGGTVSVERQGEVTTEPMHGLGKLREIAASFKPVAMPDLPPFLGGGVGYFAYDLVRQFEKLPATAKDDLGLDDYQVMYFSTILAFDHLKHRIHIIVNIFNNRDGEGLEEKYQDALLRIEQIEKRLNIPISLPAPPPLANIPEPESNVGESAYYGNVEAAKKHIYAGDIFQVVLSQRFSMPVTCDPFDIYRALRYINPSPYLFFLRMDDVCLVGSSPEMLVKARGGPDGCKVEYGPIAGTRPRGETPEEDERLRAELLADEKERSEHIMLVDLGRNDLGRVCDYGTVKVTDLMRIEKYSHVMHLVSTVEGKLRDDLDCFHALEACLPAGTVSGAPKVRAMEIIEEREPARRGVYGGAVGYVDFSGNLDTCIALRTLVVKDGVAYIQAGGGIVADSDPEREREESVNKASALIRAVKFAHEGLR
ncbi:MAG: anthranilate synthase component I [Acidobacteriota bacterium]|jgi:anthranilate synthase component 1|nr:anthranilate synthase component I [Acidobacteriota bacterium]